jgi:uncharacterized lipoprotein YddW (UPF0748 family)
MNRLLCCTILIIVNGFTSFNVSARQIPQEMRGVWVSTVFNIDWPSRAGLDAATQKAEAIAILDQAKSLGLNTVFLQVRPSGDAIYPSALVPWSRFLSGRQGQPTQPSYDPLQFWIEQAHRRGLELHAWINPFRATTGLNDHLDTMHAMVRRPDWVVQYGNRNYFDPGLPEVRQHLLEVIAELITRYDIDGLHIDDYFYPYPVWGTEFPDTLSFSRFGNGNPVNRNDWRRENINTVIRSISNLVQQQKPWIRFGVSPFGVWRNRSTDSAGSDTRAGIESYDHLFADVLLWERNGWVDYVIPQLYWDKRDNRASFQLLLNWWNQNIRNRHLYIGHAVYKIDPANQNWGNPAEVPGQIRAIQRLNRPSGSVFFSQRHFNRTDLLGLADTLSNDLFRLPAITPNMPWIDNNPPPPVLSLRYHKGEVSWEVSAGQNPFNEARRFIVHLEPVSGRAKVHGPVWFITGETRFKLPRRPLLSRSRYHLSVMPVDRNSNVGAVNTLYRIYY